MAWKKVFVGFDLGDGESITDFSLFSSSDVDGICKTRFAAMTMPDSNTPGRAIPSVFGFDEAGNLVFANSILEIPDLVKDVRVSFKRRPSDLIPGLDEGLRQRLLTAFADLSRWPEEPACCTPEMQAFREAVITFTNAIFGDERYAQRLCAQMVGCDEIVFCVGHPTRWDKLDVAIYRHIFAGSLIGAGKYQGFPSSLVMAAESRAAFLAVRNQAESGFVPEGKNVLLVDVGSSTIDITAMRNDSRNYQYNTGNNYLGARSIDFMIREMYLEWLRQDEEEWQNYCENCRVNPSLADSLTLACRMAKERVYSSSAGVASLQFMECPKMRLSRASIDQAVRTRPIRPLLEANIELSPEAAAAMGSKTWIGLFREFLQETKREMEQKELYTGRIIITGSASRMPFVAEVLKEVFSELPDGGVLPDMDPSRSISTGLALVGPSNEKSVAFQNDLQHLLDEQLPAVVEENLPSLANALSDIIQGIVNARVLARMNQWREGQIPTLARMTQLIQEDCSEDKLMAEISENAAYKEAIRDWVSEDLGSSIALKLQSICRQYGVKNMNINDLNITRVPNITVGDVRMDVLDIGDIVVNVVAMIAGVISAIVLPTVLGVIVGLLSFILPTIASLIFGILMALPGVGWAVLLGLVGVAVFKAAQSGLDSAKEILMDKLQDAELPGWVRQRVSDDKLQAELEDANISQAVQDAILEENSRQTITTEVSAALRDEVEKRAESIKYIIESR